MQDEWKVSKKGNHYLYVTSNKFTGTAFRKHRGVYGIVIQKRKGEPVFSSTTYSTLVEAKNAIEALLLDPAFDFGQFTIDQRWQTSKSGNPYRKVDGTNCTVFARGGGFRFVIDSMYSEMFESAEEAMAEVDELAEMLGPERLLQVIHQSVYSAMQPAVVQRIDIDGDEVNI